MRLTVLVDARMARGCGQEDEDGKKKTLYNKKIALSSQEVGSSVISVIKCRWKTCRKVRHHRSVHYGKQSLLLIAFNSLK